MDFEHLDAINDWEKWKKTLGKSVKLAQSAGLSDETISNIGTKLGTFLSATVDPENREERLLQQLWRHGDDIERHHLASMLVKMVQNDNDL